MIIIIKPFTAAFVLISALLIGCAAPGIRFAKQNANQVKTGMSVSQASAILGVAPNNTGNDFAEWRSNERDSYDGTPRGSVRFQVKDGLIVGVPDAGIISPEAAGIYFAELNGAQYKAEAERAAVLAEEKQRVQDQRRRDAEAAASAQAAAAAAKAKELREQRMRELEAERKRSYFSLAKLQDGRIFGLTMQYKTDGYISRVPAVHRDRITSIVIQNPRTIRCASGDGLVSESCKLGASRTEQLSRRADRGALK